MFNFGGSTEQSNSSQSSQSHTSQSQSTQQQGSSTTSQNVQTAGLTEQQLMATVMNMLTGNASNAYDLVSGGVQDSIRTAQNEYLRLIESGTKSALGALGKTGMNSSLINGLVGSLNEGAAGQLAAQTMNLQATMPLQAIQAVNSTTSPLLSMLQGYFQNERFQNVTQESNQSGSSLSQGGSSTNASGTTSSTTSGFNFGASFG